MAVSLTSLGECVNRRSDGLEGFARRRVPVSLIGNRMSLWWRAFSPRADTVSFQLGNSGSSPDPLADDPATSIALLPVLDPPWTLSPKLPRPAIASSGAANDAESSNIPRSE